MKTISTGFATSMALLPKAMLAAAIFWAPLMAVKSVQAGSASIIESSYKASSGAGFVLMVSLQRAR